MTLDQKLLLYAQQFEDQHAPENITTTLREAAAEIERLRKEMVHIRADNFMLREELNNQEDLNDSFREENESLRAALGHVDACIVCGQIDQARKAIRAALETKA